VHGAAVQGFGRLQQPLRAACNGRAEAGRLQPGGRVDAFWDTGLGPWDVAAGALLVAEAGGRCTAVNGHPFEAGSGNVLAAGAAVHGALLALLNVAAPCG
jgi:myo-inositol-1(or 4)-monophosphatase